MRRALLALSVSAVALACGGLLKDLTGAGCDGVPCGEGYLCRPETKRCVLEKDCAAPATACAAERTCVPEGKACDWAGVDEAADAGEPSDASLDGGADAALPSDAGGVVCGTDAGGVCAGAWAWENPLPHGSQPSSAAAAANGSAYVFGTDRAVMRVAADGFALLPLVPVADTCCFGGFALTDGDLWAVGAASAHWDGSAWTPSVTPDEWLRGVWAGRPERAWAVAGEKVSIGSPHDTLFVWSAAGGWVPATSQPKDSVAAAAGDAFLAVWGAASGADDLLWLAGASGNVYAFDGKQWSVATSLGAPVFSVWGTSATDVWAAGGSGKVKHLTGGAWADASLPSTTEDALSVYGGKGSVYVQTTRALYLRQAAGWKGIASGLHLEGGAGNEREAIAIGFDPAAGPAFARLDGATVTPLVPRTATTNALYAGVAVSAEEAWAAGEGGVVLHRTAAKGWQKDAYQAPGELLDLWAASPSDVWAVGRNGTLAHYDGSAWSTVTTAAVTTEDLYSVVGLGSGNVLATGDNGLVLRWNGQGWQSVTCTWGTPGTAPCGVNLYGSGTDGKEMYLAGGGGLLLRTDGTTYTVVQTDTVADFHDVAAAGTSIVVTGFESVFRRSNGAATFVPIGQDANFFKIWAKGPDDFFLLDDRGHLLHAGAVSPLEVVPTLSGADMGGVFGFVDGSTTHVWTAGSFGRIEHGRP